MKKKILLAVMIAVLAFASLTVIFSKALFGEKAVAVMEYVVGINDDLPDYADANGDGKVDVLDVILLVKEGPSPRLDTLTISSDRYSVDFNKYTTEYTVELPAGRPVIPLVEGESAEGSVKVTQAFIPDGGSSGTATVTVSNENGSTEYKINFVRDASNGFALQYDDRYDVSSEPVLAGKEGIEYHSTASDKVSIDENGVIRAIAVTDEPTIVYANYQGSTVWQMTVDRVEKARINLFLITGQSNGQGCYATSVWSTDGSPSERDIKVAEQHTFIEQIGVSGAVYGFDVFPRSENSQVYSLKNTLYDLNEHDKQGWEPSLGKVFYESSGEKVVFLQTAYSGSPIQSWLDPDRHPEGGGYPKNYRYNFYDYTQTAYPKLLTALGDNYEIVRTCNFWWHGGTAMTSVYDQELADYINVGAAGYDATKRITAQEYYDYYMMMHNDMMEDFGLDYDFIVLNRDTKAAASPESVALQRHTDLVPIRQAQIALAGTNEDILICSRVSDWARMKTSTDTETYGYGYVGEDNTHYSQVGHNENGRVSGLCAFEYIFGTTDESEAYLDVIATNGRDALTPADTIELKEGEVYRSGSIYMPFSAGVGVNWSSSDESVATVDIFGTVTGVSGGEAVITATATNGVSGSFNVRVKSSYKAGVDYLWEFNDLTSSLDKNDLTVSDYTIAQGAENNYTIANGKLTQSSSLASKQHPDFILEKPIELDSTRDWYIEWRAKLTKSSVLLGNATPDDGSATIPGYIYLAYGVNFASSGATPYYPFRLLTGSSTITIPYGDFKSANTSLNTWRVAYSSSTGKVTLYLEQNGEFTEVGSASTGPFDFTMDCMFGRFKGGTMGINGDVDYIRVHTNPSKAETTTYLWDFSSLASADGNNDLRISDFCVDKGTDGNYTLSDGIYTVKSGTTSGNRPDFTLATPITFDSEHSWSVEWRAKQGGSCVILGSDTPAGQSTIQSYIYAAPTAAFGSGNDYSLRFNYGKSSVYLPYGDYKPAYSSWNTWRLRYDAAEHIIYFELLEDDEFTVVSSKTLSVFSTSVDTMFGRFKDASTGFSGSCDYIKVTIEGA